jgi:hypothetical protein
MATKQVARFQKTFSMGAVCFGLALSVLAPSQAFSAAHPESSVSEGLEETKKDKSVGRRILDRLGSLDISFKADILDLEIVEGVHAALRYRYRVEPSYKGDYHLRMDRWRLQTDLRPGDLIGGSETTRIGLNMSHGAEVLFVRAFKSKKEAFTSLPYAWKQIPFTADDIISKLEIGDFVAFTANMNVLVGASSLVGPAASFPATFATHYLVSGEFQVHVFKTEENKASLKLFAIRKKEKSGSVRVGYADDLRITGLRVVDRRIERLSNLTDVFRLQYKSTESNLLMVDYRLDLRDPAVRDAYDGVMSSALELKTLSIANPLKGDHELANRLISDVTPFENIFTREKPRVAQDRSIDRVFKGRNDIDKSSQTGFRFGAILFRFEQEREYVENALTSIDADETPEFYRLHTFQRRNESKWWFSYYKAESVSRASLLFETDKDHSIRALKDVVFEWDYRDKSLTKSEFKMVQAAVRQAVPEFVYSKIKWGAWAKPDEHANSRFLYRMALHPEAMERLGRLNQQMNAGVGANMVERLSDYVLSIPRPTSPSIDPFQSSKSELRTSRFHTVVDDYRYDITNIAHYLGRVFDDRLTAEERSDAFGELRFNNLFIEIGPGFLVSLLESTSTQADLGKLVYFNVALTADDIPPVYFEYGDVQDRKVLKAAQYIHSVLNARDVDIAIQLPR